MKRNPFDPLLSLIPGLVLPDVKTTKNIKVIVVEENETYRDTFSDLLERDKFTVLASTGDGNEVIAIINPDELPDIAIISYKTSKPETLNTAIRLKKAYPSVKIVVNTLFNVNIPIQEFKDTGVDGLLIKSMMSTEQKVNVLRHVYSGYRIYPVNTLVFQVSKGGS